MTRSHFWGTFGLWRRTSPDQSVRTSGTIRTQLPEEASTADIEEDSEPIVKMAGAAGIDSRGSKGDQVSLLGYFWSVETDEISTAKEDDLNFHPQKRGIRPGWARIREAEDLLRLHKEKPLKHRHALAACHSCFDPLNQVPWLGALQKFVYRVYCINTELKTEGKTRDFDDILCDDYVENHLFAMVAATLEAKRRLSIARTWQLPLCIERNTIEVELDTICDGSWSILAGSACLTYLVQRYQWKNEDQVSIHLYGGQVALNPMLKPHHQLSSELGGMQLAQKATDTALESLKDFNLAPQPVSPLTAKRR